MSKLFWVVLDREQKEKSEELLATFDKSSKDEFGLMGLTIALSNLMFPGTSVLHTRLRYLFLVGWIYQKSFKNMSVDTLHRFEKELRKILQKKSRNSQDEDYRGILGITKEIDIHNEGATLSQPPFSLYLNLLRAWGVIKEPFRQLHMRELSQDMFDEEYLSIINSDIFRLDSFLFDEEQREKSYIKKHLPPSLLKDIIENSDLEDISFQDISTDVTNDDTFQKQLKYSQNLSILMWGSMLYYDHYLGNDSSEIIDAFALWCEQLSELLEKSWTPDDTIELLDIKFREGIHNSNRVIFITSWYKYLKANPNPSLQNPARIEDMSLFDFLERRENMLKGDRARLTKCKSSPEYSESNARYGFHPIEYRWSNIRRFIKDFNATS